MDKSLYSQKAWHVIARLCTNDALAKSPVECMYWLVYSLKSDMM